MNSKQLRDIRIDCRLGRELKAMRVKNELTLMTMSIALKWKPSKLSNYENNIGALTNSNDAKAIENYCELLDWKLPASALILAKQGIATDLAPLRAMIKSWLSLDFGANS